MLNKKKKHAWLFPLAKGSKKKKREKHRFVKVNIVCLLVFVHLCVARQCAARKGTRMHKTLTSLLRRLAKCRTSKEKKGRPQRRRPPQRGVTVQYPGLKREVKSRPASLSCDVGLLMASASRSRVESCSGGLELVLCPHYPIEPARVRA